MKKHYSVIVIGGGQAGLSISYCLKNQGIDHIVLEKNQIGYSWQAKRWDTFCLVTPNWQCTLPGYHYPGNDPNGFMEKDEIVNYIQEYAKSFNPPIKEGVEVFKVRKNQPGGLFELSTSLGNYTADQVVIATGSYHQPKIPRMAEKLPEDILQLHSSHYKNPQSLPEGEVLVVGTGQSGCQIAEDLHLAKRKVHLCVGGAPRSPRRYRGKDVVDWLDQLGYYDLTIENHPDKENVRTKTNHYVTGRSGGHEIDLRTFAKEGMQLYGSLKDIKEDSLEFKPNLKQNLDRADEVAESIKKTIDEYITKKQISVPNESPYQSVWQPETEVLELNYKQTNISSVIWCIGYQANFSWIEVPVFDGLGYPSHDRGVTSVRGLYFLGLPWLYTWGSGRFSGIARDAEYLCDYIADKMKYAYPGTLLAVNEAAIGS
ncbi:Flavin-dependent oxidoreductase, MSMEG_0569 family [Hyella patelloides LEGE 07179]|uniref:Flavin-dependent oxidoreductase, MSMEG_0569 family n=1 Tax=Hyella patelloides LEGE 07179 TaxID=945734 RepID=A0A563W3R1_9CYAN|nr:MSMEG_0569 family flavin-dependent oxidoreductase [Hyella patelloides]VEP18193.1 Flavin-dependent oxidoreductase, MSMEG_0569 family [Hyella patelloides LEGE 07179]